MTLIMTRSRNVSGKRKAEECRRMRVCSRSFVMEMKKKQASEDRDGARDVSLVHFRRDFINYWPLPLDRVYDSVIISRYSLTQNKLHLVKKPRNARNPTKW